MSCLNTQAKDAVPNVSQSHHNGKQTERSSATTTVHVYDLCGVRFHPSPTYSLPWKSMVEPGLEKSVQMGTASHAAWVGA